MPAPRTVTVGVPYHRGEQFVLETLESVQRQTYGDFRVLISVDGPDPRAAEVCAPFLRDSRFSLSVRPQRLGWVGNIDWLMARAVRDSAYWCYQQQDDVIDPTYLELLVAHLEARPEAAVAYTDLVGFGTLTWAATQPSVTGSPVARQLALLSDHRAAVAFRGLTRTDALRAMGRMPTNRVENFLIEATWMLAMARSGELHRVPGQLYRKRYHEGNIHTKWAQWPLPRRRRGWRTHCVDALAQAMLVEATAAERRLLWAAAVARLVSPRLSAGYLEVERLTPAERDSELDAFFGAVRRRGLDLPGLLDTTWPELRRWTSGYHHLPGPLPPARRVRLLGSDLKAAAGGTRRRLSGAMGSVRACPSRRPSPPGAGPTRRSSTPAG